MQNTQKHAKPGPNIDDEETTYAKALHKSPSKNSFHPKTSPQRYTQTKELNLAHIKMQESNTNKEFNNQKSQNETIDKPKTTTETKQTGEYVMARILLEVTDLWKRLATILGMLRSIPEKTTKQALDTLTGKHEDSYIEWMSKFLQV